MDDELHERIRAVISDVPAGTVATYGDIAALSGAPSPRLVGRVLAEDGHDLPWQRILRADGTPAPHLVHEQLERLRAEGVLADGQRVNLRKYRWQPDGPPEDDGPPGLFEERAL
ncbi:MGMT family protein [Amycolatopsis sp. FDAARGOS 1241]|uniref:MGMT family protein n=1 Tax=Amycolatopsis sp. FDAARGOS 1241 TaxID=2778070 RepID=UPI0019514E0D|nr:MGMT family protein [Amycolatopsis sp. FDAARGOS 1241]QRP45021.1 MGMT family protein [Amycolatopsis sp. FDAARGOS 1241]